MFFQTWHAFPQVAEAPALLERWREIRAARAEVQKELERLREAGKIGSPLAAHVEIGASGARYDALAAAGDELRFVMITSQAAVRNDADAIVASAEPAPEVRALLALPRRRRRRPRASDDLRALRLESRTARARRAGSPEPGAQARALARGRGARRGRRPGDEGARPGVARAGRADPGHPVRRSRARLQHRGRVQLPRRRRRLAARLLHRDRRRRHRPDRLAPGASFRRAGVLRRPGAHPRRRDRQPVGSHRARTRRRLRAAARRRLALSGVQRRRLRDHGRRGAAGLGRTVREAGRGKGKGAG